MIEAKRAQKGLAPLRPSYFILTSMIEDFS